MEITVGWMDMLTPDEAKDRLQNFADREWREYQRETISWAMDKSKKIKVIEAPTGSGKSLLSMVCGIMAGQSNYIVGTKMLQKQISDDYPEASVLWGRSNYPCLLHKDKTCAECTNTKMNPCPARYSCLYKKAKKETLANNLRVLNFSYYISEVAYAGLFSGTPYTIVDEADSLESTLIQSVQLEFSERALYRLGMKDGPTRRTATSKDKLEPWLEFGNAALMKAGRLVKQLKDEVEEWEEIESDYQLQQMKELEYFTHLTERCQIFINNVTSEWIMEETPRQGSRGGKLTFRPLWLSQELANQFMWQHSDNFILLSASFLPVPVLCKTLGLDEDDVDYKQIPSTFPIENRPLHIWPVCNMTNKTHDEELPKMIQGIKLILEMNKGLKGVVHSTSFKLAREIIEGVGDRRLITHTPYDRQEVIDEFINNTGDWVLVSPSVERGLDLKGDLCRFVAYPKAPYLSLGDRVTSMRLYGSKLGQLWYKSSMMLNVLQGCGRGMRSADDWCRIYLIDMQIKLAFEKNPSLWPIWFSSAEVWQENILLKDIA